MTVRDADTGVGFLQGNPIPALSLVSPSDTHLTAPKVIAGQPRQQVLLADPLTGQALEAGPLVTALKSGGFGGAALNPAQAAAGAVVGGVVSRSAAQLSTTPLAVDVTAKDTILIKGPTGQVYYVSADGTQYVAIGTAQGEIYPDQLGAAGDFSTDDSAIMTVALSGLWQKVKIRPGAGHVMGDVPVANGVTIEGSAGLDYTTIHTYMKPKFIRKAGCNAVLNVNNQANATVNGRGITIIGIFIDGIDNTCNGISAGGSHLTMYRVYIANCIYGWGGQASGGSTYSNSCQATQVEIVNCTYGVGNIVDTVLLECTLAANGTNLRVISGSNSNRIVGGRFEWASVGQNILLTGNGGAAVDAWNITGLQLDRGAAAGIYMDNVTNVQISNVMHRRAGAANGGLGANCQIFLQNTNNIMISNPRSQHGFDDGGGGNDTPSYFLECNQVNTSVVLDGGSVVGGYTVQAIHYNSSLNTTQMPGHKITGVNGLDDYDNTSSRWKVSGRECFGKPAHLGVLTAGTGNATVTGLQVPGPSANDARGYALLIWTRNATSAARNLKATIPFQVRKDAGTATVITPTVAPDGLGTKGAIGWNGSTSITGTGQATGASNVILTLNAGASGTDDAYVGWTFTATGGTNSGWTGVCIGYNGTTKQAHMHRPAAAAFDATTTFSGRSGSQIQISAAANIAQTGDGPVTFDLTVTNISADNQDVWLEIVQ